jgi:uncharacterized protein with PIN domain
MTTTERPVKLLCDEMLGGLGRWLRAAGHDTATAGRGLPDAKVVEHALREHRLLLTCDGALATHRKGAGTVVTLASNGLEATARELGERVSIDWLYAPFTRCLVDNTPLEAADAMRRADIPPRARLLGGAVTACPACGRLYWPGSHVRRMRAKLERWQELAAAGREGPGAVHATESTKFEPDPIFGP